MSLLCCLGWHEDAIRDQAADGAQVLRCPRCMSICAYPATDPQFIAQLRAEQKQQAEAIALKRHWRTAVDARQSTARRNLLRRAS